MPIVAGRIARVSPLLVLAASALVGCPAAKDDSTADAGEGASNANPCHIDSGWAGDDKCLPAPEPSKGFQLHFGPKSYDDAKEVERYTLGPGEERMLCTYLITPNDHEIHYDDWRNSLRPGSHHMIVELVGAGEEQAGVACSAADGMSNQGIIGGNTTTVKPLDDLAPENEGLAHTLPAHARVSMQLHFFNTTDHPVLMEAWQNIYYMDEKDVKGLASPIESMAGLGMSVKPGTTQVITGKLVAPSDLRVVDLYSHNHDHTRRFTVYLRRAGEKTREQIYESYDWEHPLLLPLDSIHDNEPADRAKAVAGGSSGKLELSKGDALEFECEIDNDDLDQPLRFANEAHTAEMCIMRGDYTPSMSKAWSSYAF